VTPAFAKEYYEVRQELPRSFLHWTTLLAAR